MQNVKKGAESALLPSTCVCSTAKINLETAQTKNYSERKALPRAVLVRKSPKKLFGKYVWRKKKTNGVNSYIGYIYELHLRCILYSQRTYPRNEMSDVIRCAAFFPLSNASEYRSIIHSYARRPPSSSAPADEVLSCHAHWKIYWNLEDVGARDPPHDT